MEFQCYVVIGLVFIRRDGQVVLMLQSMITRIMSELGETMSISRSSNLLAPWRNEGQWNCCWRLWREQKIPPVDSSLQSPGRKLQDFTGLGYIQARISGTTGSSCGIWALCYDRCLVSLKDRHFVSGLDIKLDCIEKQASMPTLCDWNQFIMAMFQ